MLPPSSDVLIVGAGPTGMALAISLLQSGIDHVIVDKLPQGQNTSRAAVIHAHTLEMLEPLGVNAELTGRGIRLADFAIRDRGRALLKLKFDKLPSRYPYLLMLPQDITEAVLAERYMALGGTIHRGVEVSGLRQDGDGAVAELQSAAGAHRICGRYVVGADGMHSIVRDAAGIRFDGKTYEESFVLADVRMDWPLGSSEVSLFFSPAGLVVVAPLPENAFRIVATFEQAPEHVGIPALESLLAERGPGGASAIREVIWSSRFHIHHRVVPTYRNGRLLLMGDAAHVHSPAGGQGMNTGLVDAMLLAKVLSGVIGGARPESDLDAYGDARRHAATEVLGLAGRLTGMATMRNAGKRMIRNAALSGVNLMPPAKRKLVMNLSGLARSGYSVLQ